MEKQPLRLLHVHVQPNASKVWDCGSTLYDSFELESLRRQLDSALSARSLSMPHLSDNDHSSRRPTKVPPPQPPKKHTIVPRSLLWLFRSVFKSIPARRGSSDARGTNPSCAPLKDEQLKPRWECNPVFTMDDKHPIALSTIPEEAPHMGAVARRTASERFGAKLVGSVRPTTNRSKTGC
ncbi:hypothetical protein MLD38_010388 [Melastoma candidum]|uniref:Uncharacterized protein n=1 Tax=Melastoma candidum TaxID=119954 RepID=A0ACB9R093_9MYRT|nr:hypothetical protein MLD38_010388 [Melastoma candidum]